MSVTPDVEKSITGTEEFQFAGAAAADDGPDLVEVVAYGGDASFSFLNTTEDPDVSFPGQDPPWWPGQSPLGDAVYVIKEGIPRPFGIRGTGIDTISVVIGTATSVVVSCSKRR